MIHHINLRHLF